MNNTLPLLLAAPGWEEIFTVFVAIVFFVVWLVNQINDARKQQQARDQAPPEPPQPTEEQRAVPPAAQADPLRAQVDEFLRRAGKQPGGEKAAPTQPMPAGREEIVVLLDESAAAEPRQKSIERKKLPSAMPTARERRPPVPPRSTQPAPAKRRTPKLRPQSVSEYVSEHVGGATRQFEEEVADLGQRVKQADEQFDIQLNRRFGNDLGSFGSRGSASDQPATPVAATPASDIAAMLASPAGVRQAIVVNEILRRPTDRW